MVAETDAREKQRVHERWPRVRVGVKMLSDFVEKDTGGGMSGAISIQALVAGCLRAEARPRRELSCSGPNRGG